MLMGLQNTYPYRIEVLIADCGEVHEVEIAENDTFWFSTDYDRINVTLLGYDDENCYLGVLFFFNGRSINLREIAEGRCPGFLPRGWRSGKKPVLRGLCNQDSDYHYRRF